jgi:PII-like signaling protein
MREEFAGRMLRIHFGEDDKWQDVPLAEAILGKCRELGIAHAFVFRGIEGYGAGSRIRRSSLFSKDAPIQVSVIDSAEQVERLIPFLDTAVEEGLVASSDVVAIRYRRRNE